MCCVNPIFGVVLNIPKCQLFPRDAGFTLLEVLVALFILGLTLAFLTRTISESLKRAERIDTQDRAITFADSTLSRLGYDIPLRIGTIEGNEEVMHWRLSVTPVLSGQSDVTLDDIDLLITNKSGHVIGHWQTLRLSERPPSQ